MSLIRRLILTFALLAWAAPALAQAPPPVAALPDTERRTSYSISGTTCACAVNFALYGDSTDYQNWVEVFVNGNRVNFNDATLGWTITSPTGPLATIPRPITDAVLTFTNAQTGTIQIVGARRPRRVSQFTENRGVAARDLNQALTDIIAQNRETWDKINDVSGRVPLARPGETLNLLPILANRLNQGACFDSGGNLTTCVSVPSSTFAAGAGITFTGTNPTTISTAVSTCGQGLVCSGGKITLYGQFWLGDYGAACDNATDDSTAFSNAITAAGAIGGAVKIPLATCKIASNIVISTSIAILKIEGEDQLQSGLNFTASSGVGLAYTTNFGGIELRDFNVACGTAVTCIQIGSSSNAPVGTVERVRFTAGGAELSVLNGSAFHVQHNTFFQCTTACLVLSAPANPDGGDSWVSYNYMLNSSGLAGMGIGIEQQSGGGWKITNNKINQFNENYYLNAAFASGASSDYQIQDNSLEGCATACILLQNNNTTGALINVIISTNEMGGSAGSYGIELQANPTPAAWVTNFNIVGNIIRGVNATAGISINGAAVIGINANTITDAGTCNTGIAVGTLVTSGFVTSNTITNCTTKVNNNGTSVTAANNGP